MTYNLTKIQLDNFVSWCNFYKKRLNHEHIAFLNYLYGLILDHDHLNYAENKKNYYHLSISEITLDFITLKTSKMTFNLLNDLVSCHFIDYLVSEDNKSIKLRLQPVPYLFLLNTTFSGMSKENKRFIIQFLYFSLSLEKEDKEKILSQFSDNVKSLFDCFFSILNFNTENAKCFNHVIKILPARKNELKNTIKKLKIVDITEKRNLSDEEFNILYPAVKIWNEVAKNHGVLTYHKIKDIADKPVSKSLLRAAKILHYIETQNFGLLPDKFYVFENRSLTHELLKKTIEQYASVLTWKNSKTKGTFYNFLYNPSKDFSWLCYTIKFPPLDYEKKEELKDFYAQYEKMLGYKKEVTNEERSEIILAVNNLYTEFLKIRKKAGWFYKYTKKNYQLNNWDSFVIKHQNFLKKIYKNVKVSMMKPILNNGKFSTSYTKFIAYVADTCNVALYPSAKEMKILLNIRALKLKRKGLLSTNHPMLTQNEYQQYLKKEIELLYDDNC